MLRPLPLFGNGSLPPAVWPRPNSRPISQQIVRNRRSVPAREGIKVVKKVTLPDGSEVEMSWLVGLRDRALMAVMTYTFARDRSASRDRNPWRDGFEYEGRRYRRLYALRTDEVGRPVFEWTRRWREMDSNHRYRIRNNPFWLPPFGPAIRLPQQKPALSCRGPMVRIHLPPALSPLRTSFSGGKRENVRGDDNGRSRDDEYLKRNRWFESGSLQRGVRCEPDFRWRIPSMTVGDFAKANPAPL
jgi:hypothetical protein